MREEIKEYESFIYEGILVQVVYDWAIEPFLGGITNEYKTLWNAGGILSVYTSAPVTQEGVVYNNFAIITSSSVRALLTKEEFITMIDRASVSIKDYRPRAIPPSRQQLLSDELAGDDLVAQKFGAAVFLSAIRKTEILQYKKLFLLTSDTVAKLLATVLRTQRMKKRQAALYKLLEQ